MSWLMSVAVTFNLVTGLMVMIVVLAMILEWLQLGQRLWYLRCLKWLAAWLPGTWKKQFLIVRLLGQTNKVFYALALPHEDHHLMAYVSGGTYAWEKIPLHPRGVVVSTLSQLMAWDHVDPDLHIQQLLTHYGYRSVDAWLEHHPADKIDLKYDLLYRNA